MAGSGSLGLFFPCVLGSMSLVLDCSTSLNLSDSEVLSVSLESQRLEGLTGVGSRSLEQQGSEDRVMLTLVAFCLVDARPLILSISLSVFSSRL